ncbi:MAG: hypothetical protein KAU48_05080 [Candidatus Thorarchaeota archaeon]|nr:hypothetical protein [Candidatus Thorarchaeota archaeon]
MIEEPKNALREIASDPNFLMILAGAIIWYMGYYVLFFGGLFLTTGFILVCFSAALTSLSRPVALAWPGLLLGGLLQIVGYFIFFIPFLSPALIVIGGVAIVYFAIPLALQRGELPVITHLQKLIESKMNKEEIEDIAAEEPSKEDTDTTEEESGP